MRRFCLNVILFSGLLIAFTRCANVSVPSGGPRDMEPPKVLKENPENNTRNFKGNKIEVEFNEFVNLNNFSEQVMVTPSMKEKPKAKVKGKKIIITFQDTLAENTTYSIYMGEAIADITEGNKVQGYKYAFSTGNYIDSLIIEGVVQNASDMSGMSKTWVLLYPYEKDTLIYKGLPYYITRTDANGIFRFSNLKNKQYFIAALREENGNYLYDVPGEKIGFLAQAVQPHPIDSVQRMDDKLILRTFEELPVKQFVKKVAGSDYRKVRILFNIPTVDFKVSEIKDPNYSSNIKIEKGVIGDSITLWLPESDKDSIYLSVSDGDLFNDTVDLSLLKKDTKLKGGKTIADALNFACIINKQNSMLEANQDLQIEMQNPLATYKRDLIKVSVDNNEVGGDLIKCDSIGRKWKFNLNLKNKQSVKVEILPGAFTDLLGLVNTDTIIKEFKIRDSEYYGNLNLSFKQPDSSRHYIIQLLNDKGNIVQQQICAQDSLLLFRYLAPGTYRIKAIFDANGNKKWDSGNYSQRIQPENVFFYKESVTIRSNWDVEVEWKL